MSKRMNNLDTYLFVGIASKIAEKKARGEEVISFAIGDPDLPTPEHIINKLCQAAREPANHRYPETTGLPELRKSIANWYKKRFEVLLDPNTEVLPLIGSKEGIGHIAFCFLDNGDISLVPDPAYPVYSISTMLAGGQAFYMPLKADNKFLPDLDIIPQSIAEKAKLIWLNYPNNPTSAVAGIDFFTSVIQFARKHSIAVCHDNPYSEVSFDDYQPVSFLQAEGAREVGIEFHSLSKSYNMTGWRIGMAVGNACMIEALMKIKSNLDSGIPQAIQYAAIEALSGSQECIAKHNSIYQRRRDLIIESLKDIGLEAQPPQASLYVWARVPEGYNSKEFADDLLEQVGVVVIPGTGYGKYGEGYVRLSLTIPDAALVKGLSRMASWHNTKKPFRSKKK